MSSLESPLVPHVAPGEAGVRSLLEQAAAEAGRLARAAYETGNFAEVARWNEATQALHRALIALEAC